MRAKFLDIWARQPRKEKEPRKVSSALSFNSAFVSAYRKATGAESSEGMNGLVNEVCIVHGVQICLMISLFIQYIRYEMPRKFGLGTGAKEKFEALESDLDNLTRNLWRSDECCLRHDRIRLQLTFYVLVHAYSGARPGTFLEGKYYRGSGRCLKYKVSNSRKCTCLGLKMTRTLGYTCITVRTEPLGGCSRSLNGISKGIPVSMKTRSSSLPRMLLSVTNPTQDACGYEG